MIFRQALTAILLASGSIGPVHASVMLRRVPQPGVQAPLPPPIEAAAKRAGLTAPEIFWWETYDLIRRGHMLAAFLSGRADDLRPDGHEKSCFQAILLPNGRAQLVATMGRTVRPDLDCHGIVALGALPSTGSNIRIGILYAGASAQGNRNEPVVLVWHRGGRLAIDDRATQLAAKAHAATIRDIRAANASTDR